MTVSAIHQNLEEITSQSFCFGGQDMLADISGALWWGKQRTLIVSDLHLEQGSSSARFGGFVPPYDTMASLRQLAEVLYRYAPDRVIMLGDSFHDRHAFQRLSFAAKAKLISLQAHVSDWVWITGNHDPLPPEGLRGRILDELSIETIGFRHEPAKDIMSGFFEIAGHLHACARVRGKSGSVRRKCFAVDRRRIIMPAFGAYTGGLELSHKAYKDLFDKASLCAYVLGTARVYSIPGCNLFL
jgi:DNA ligase-associated metallophosphoesterase